MLTQEQKSYLEKQKQNKKEEAAPGFDLRAQILDRDGEMQMKQDYFIHLQGTQEFFERPIGSGNLFYRNGEPAGRLELGKDGSKTFDQKAEHKAFKAPLDADAELFERFKAQERQLEAAQKELDAIKKEKLMKEKEAALKVQEAGKRFDTKTEQPVKTQTQAPGVTGKPVGEAQ